MYAVVTQPSGVNQGLVVAKARLAKQGLTIPRLELVSGHMAANLVHNVQEALEGFPVIQVHCRLDSSVALHWICGMGNYKQFVHNRVQKIQAKEFIQWRHVGTLENPADLGSWGGGVSETRDLWWQGPEWLSHPECWPPDIITSATQETLTEAKTVRELFKVAMAEKDELDQLLAKWNFVRALIICAWISRFTRNARGAVPGRSAETKLAAE